MRDLARAVLAVARVAWLEGAAARLPAAIPVYALLVAGAAFLLPAPDPADRARVVLDASVAASFAVAALAIGAFAATTVSREFETGLEASIAVKPAGSTPRIFGRAFGLALWAALLVAAQGAIGWTVLAASTGRSAGAPAFARPARFEAGRSGVFLGPHERTPRELSGTEAFSVEGEARPMWVFEDAPAGPARLSVSARIRQARTDVELGSVLVAARRGNGRPEGTLVRVQTGRPSLVEVAPPGEGALEVVLHPVEGALLEVDGRSVRRSVGEGSFLANYASAQVGVFLAVLAVGGIGLFFSATCRSRVALLYTTAVALAAASLGPMRTFERVLGEGPEAVADLERTLESFGPGASGEHDHDHAASSADPGAGWSGLGATVRVLVAALPDLGANDFRGDLASGVRIEPGPLAGRAARTAGSRAVLLSRSSMGRAWTAREGRR